jgi:ubiquinone/menaquinone biosynthesis C-methylase UbiE
MLAPAGWTAYSLAMLALSPHRFFARLARLGWYGGMLGDWVGGLHLPPASRVLEVGCSAGSLSHALARRGHAVAGVDRSARAIRLARAAMVADPARPVFTQADARQLPFASASFDATLAASLLNVVAEPQQLVAEMARVTIPGGIVTLLFPTARLSAVAARQFTARHALAGFAAQALGLWAALARKLEPEAAERLLAAERLTDISSARYLDGMIGASTGRRSTRGGV